MARLRHSLKSFITVLNYVDRAKVRGAGLIDEGPEDVELRNMYIGGLLGPTLLRTKVFEIGHDQLSDVIGDNKTGSKGMAKLKWAKTVQERKMGIRHFFKYDPSSLPFEEVMVIPSEGEFAIEIKRGEVPVKEVELLGILLFQQGAVAFLLEPDTDAVVVALLCLTNERGVEWMALDQLEDASKPFWLFGVSIILGGILGELCETFSRAGPSTKVAVGKREAKNLRRRMGKRSHVPKAFYIIHPSKSAARRARAELNERSQADWSYRWDVSGHERVRVRKGDAPMDPGTKKKLGERGYHIYEDGPPAGEDRRRLVERGHIWQQGEWLALLTTKVKAHTKGPEDAPYIPGTRRL